MNRSRSFVAVATLGAFVSLSSLTLLPATVQAGDTSASAVEQGKQLAFSRKDGNCLACHMMADAMSPGTIAPPLVAMKSRFSDKAKLRAQIWDSTARNPETSMPPFGKHGILTEEQIDHLVEFVWTL